MENDYNTDKRKAYVKETQTKIKEFKKGKDVVNRSALRKALQAKKK